MIENTSPDIQTPIETRGSTSKKTQLALAALMALTPVANSHGDANLGTPNKIEAKSNKVEIFQNVTVQAIGPSYIDGQKRYQEIAILAGGDPKTHSGTLTVRVMKEMGTDQEQIGQLTKGADGEFWFTSQKVGKPIYSDIPSDGNSEQ